MKKYIIIISICVALIIIFCLIVFGCSNSQKSNKVVSETIKKADIGISDVTYTSSVNCGSKTASNSVLLSKNNHATYNLFECSGEDLHLITGEGTYTIDKDTVIVTDSYDVTIKINVNKSEINFSLNNVNYVLEK